MNTIERFVEQMENSNSQHRVPVGCHAMTKQEFETFAHRIIGRILSLLPDGEVVRGMMGVWNSGGKWEPKNPMLINLKSGNAPTFYDDEKTPYHVRHIHALMTDDNPINNLGNMCNWYCVQQFDDYSCNHARWRPAAKGEWLDGETRQNDDRETAVRTEAALAADEVRWNSLFGASS